MPKIVDAKLLDSGRVRLCGRMVYPDILEARIPPGEEASKAKYQLTLLIPKNADLTALSEIVKDCRDDNFSKAKQPKVKLPILKTAEQDRFEDYADEYPYMVRTNASLKFPPQVVDARVRQVSSDAGPDEVYGGRWAYVTVNAYHWSNPKNGDGVSLGMNNVQLLEHDDEIASGRVKAESEFEAVDLGDGEGAGNADDVFGDSGEEDGPVDPMDALMG